MRHPFPVSCCSIALRDLGITEAVEIIAEAGFPGVEVWYPHVAGLDAEELRALKDRCAELQLGMPVISPYLRFTRGREEWLASMKTAEEVLLICKALGVRKVRTFIDTGDDGIASKDAEEEHWEAAIAGLKDLCGLDPGVEFVVETHENTLADTLPSVRKVFEAVGRGNLRLNYQATRDFLERGYVECLGELFPLVSHMHWEQIGEDSCATYLEESGVIDFPALIGYLAEKQYAGTASVEYCWLGVDERRVGSAWKYLAGIFEGGAARVGPKSQVI
jgi:sugar phosphate isomerase/epimerase